MKSLIVEAKAFCKSYEHAPLFGQVRKNIEGVGTTEMKKIVNESIKLPKEQAYASLQKEISNLTKELFECPAIRDFYSK